MTSGAERLQKKHVGNEAKKDHYATLGVERDASPQQLREAFQELALRHHPDRAGSEQTGAFQEISAAYGVLSDPAQRARYDDLRCACGAALRRTPARARPGPVEPLCPGPCVPAGPTLVIDHATARHGGVIGLTVQVPAAWSWIQRRRRVWLRLPPGLADGSMISLEIPGLSPVRLRILVR